VGMFLRKERNRHKCVYGPFGLLWALRAGEIKPQEQNGEAAEKIERNKAFVAMVSNEEKSRMRLR